MIGLWLENQQVSLRNDLPQPRPRRGEALVRVRLAGICATDLELVGGYYPFTGILGHEFVGEVVEAPGFDDLLGERVVGEINIACQSCPACRRGHPSHCYRRKVLGIKDWHGAFAEYLVLPRENLWVVPAEIPDEAAVFTEPLAAALQIRQQIMIRPQDRVLLIGAGRLGQLIAASLIGTISQLGVVVRHEKQRNLLPQGIDFYTEDQVIGAGMDLVIDASGSPAGFDLACKAVRPRGIIVMKSTYTGKAGINLSALVVDEVTLVGSRCGPFAPALHMLKSRQVDPVPLIEARYALENGLPGLQAAAQPGAMKVLLYPPGG